VQARVIASLGAVHGVCSLIWFGPTGPRNIASAKVSSAACTLHARVPKTGRQKLAVYFNRTVTLAASVSKRQTVMVT
jgi:hypothetical protein